jgi:DnaK suppressor protein
MRKMPTTAELLAMPADCYMDERQLAFFRARLAAQREELLANAAQSVGQLHEENNAVADPGDRATLEEEHALEMRVRDRERKLLRKIDAALARIDGGEFGYCLETGEPIGIPRLLARPHAEYCVEAQERHETRERQRG